MSVKNIRFEAKNLSIGSYFNNSVSVDAEVDSYYYDDILRDFTADEIANNIPNDIKEELLERLKDELEPTED
jgi:hypothetical protein